VHRSAFALASRPANHQYTRGCRVTPGSPGDNLVHYRFLPALERAGLRKIRFHDLRHTFGSLLIWQSAHSRRGSPAYVREQMGHSSIQDTHCYDIAEYRNYAERFASFFGSKLENLSGSLDFFREILSGKWDRWLVINPGEEISEDRFREAIVRLTPWFRTRVRKFISPLLAANK
jgi:hypothetical protein